MSKATIIVNMRYKRPANYRQVNDLLKYLQFRDGAVRRAAYLADGRYAGNDNEAYPKINRTWIDHGLGETYQDISANLRDMRSKSVLARTWVIMPDPELMRHIPKDQHMEIVQRVTEQSMNAWFEDNGWGAPQYSCVFHEKKGEENGLDEPHAHIITPGTIPVQDDEMMLGRMGHYVKRPHLVDLRRTITRTFEMEMERVLGREKAQEVVRERNTRLEQEARLKKETRLREKAETRRPSLDWGQMARAHDVFMMLKQDAQRKKRKEKQSKKEKERQRVEYTRFYIRHRTAQQQARQREQRHQQFEQQREQWAVDAVVRRETQENLHQADLIQARYDQRQYEQEQTKRLHKQHEREEFKQRIADPIEKDLWWHSLPDGVKAKMMDPCEFEPDPYMTEKRREEFEEALEALEEFREDTIPPDYEFPF